jgi:enoyl-CoA hydratase/carnithine racemase
MAFQTLILDRNDGYAVLTLNRPPANTISSQLVLELETAIDELVRDAGVRAVVLTGAGDRIFCGGADLSSAFGGGADDDLEAFLRRGQALLRRIERSPKPVIAAIQGHATGGGCEIAMACHLRVMKETARIGQTESNLGIIPGFGGTQRLPRMIGRTKALELLILGMQITAPEALALGLINRLAKEGETLSDARALAAAIVRRAPIATRLIIECVDRGLDGPLEAGIDAEVRAFLETLRTEDAAEGIQAFFQKRPAEFKGR